MLIGAVGCDRGEGEDRGDEEVAADEEPSHIKSADWPQAPQRVVSLAPNITELLFELGLGDRVVAVTRYCDWPAEVASLARIGGMLDPDYEAILAAEPDVVVGVIDGADHRALNRFDGAQVAYGFLRVDDLESITQGVRRLGSWFDVERRADEQLERFDRELGEASERVRAMTEEGRKPTALLVFDRQPVVAAGPGSYGEELLGLAGLENAVDNDAGAYPVLDIEKVLSLDPEYIVDVTTESDPTVATEYWATFESLRAVDNRQVVHIDDPVMMRPGLRLPEAVNRLGDALEAL